MWKITFRICSHKWSWHFVFLKSPTWCLCIGVWAAEALQKLEDTAAFAFAWFWFDLPLWYQSTSTFIQKHLLLLAWFAYNVLIWVTFVGPRYSWLRMADVSLHPIIWIGCLKKVVNLIKLLVIFQIVWVNAFYAALAAVLAFIGFSTAVIVYSTYYFKVIRIRNRLWAGWVHIPIFGQGTNERVGVGQAAASHGILD